MKQRLNILVLFDSAGPPPPDQDFTEELNGKDEDWETEVHVIEALRRLGHYVGTLGVYDDVNIIIKKIKENRPDVVFNLTEVFQGKTHFDKNVVSLLEILGVPYTGAGPEGLMVCNDKAMSKKILTYHRIKVPRFQVFRRGRRVWHPKKMRFPIVVKPLREEASTGIAQASFVEDDSGLFERIGFIHNSLNMDAIAEEYIEGRELYVSVMGNQRLRVFPVREMKFSQIPEDEPKMATYKAKWDDKYRERWGIKNVFAGRLPNGVEGKIAKICTRAYRVLRIQGYGRFDLRLTPENEVFILEANPNPVLSRDEDLAQSADKVGISYEMLLERIINLAMLKA